MLKKIKYALDIHLNFDGAQVYISAPNVNNLLLLYISSNLVVLKFFHAVSINISKGSFNQTNGMSVI